MDTDTWPLSDAQIAADVAQSARLNSTYVTVDTHWEYPAYMQRWVNAVRAAGKHVWFRIHPNQWENNNGATGIMTPTAYENAERAFILAYPALFRPGDILDPCPEPENGLYWIATYGPHWTWTAPNTATRDFNAFIRATSTVADAALQQDGISGVITTVRSTNSFFATHPNALEAATVTMMGRITVDSYPEALTTDPSTATNLRLQELAAIEAIWHLPIVVGEMGYSNQINVDDTTQEQVLKAEFAALSILPYLAGVNYWVGAGGAGYGGFTNLLRGSTGTWNLRPAAYDLATFFQSKNLSGSIGQPAASTATPSATAAAASTATAAATESITFTPTASATATATLLVPTQTASPSPTRTSTGTATPVASSTSTGTATPVVSSTLTNTATPTSTPSQDRKKKKHTEGS